MVARTLWTVFTPTNLGHLPDAVGPDDGEPVAGDGPVHQAAVQEELDVAGHLAMRNTVRALLELDVLGVHTLAVVRQDVVGVNGTGRAACLLHFLGSW